MKTNLKFFQSCKTLQELKTKYRELIKVFHPDHGGNEETCKQINLEYEQTFEYILKNPISEQEKKSNFYANVNDGFRDILNKIIFIPNIHIEVCGSWLWITGDTKPVKDQLKTAGLYWAAKKSAWYWRPEGFKSNNKKSSWDMDRIRNTYGSQRVYNEQREAITA